MASPASCPGAPRPAALTRSAVLLAGGSDAELRRAVRRGTLLRPLRGGYVPPDRVVARDAFYAYREADKLLVASHSALAVLPRGSALCDETAAFLWCGLWPPDGEPRVLVPAPARCSRRPHTHIREGTLGADDVAVIDGLRVTGGTRTALDLACRARRGAALAALDALLRAGATSPAELLTALEGRARGRGVCQARALVPLADGRAESPGESIIRLALLDAGLGPVELQVPVCGGRYRVDILVRRRVIVEFEGSHHDRPDTQWADRRRFNALAALPAVLVLRYTSADLGRLGAVVTDVRRALRS